MHAQLLTLGFVRAGPKIYFSAEFGIHLTLRDDGKLDVELQDGKIVTATLTELEDTIMNGGFGEFGV